MGESFSAPDNERQIPPAVVSLCIATVHEFQLQYTGQLASTCRFVSFNLLIEAKLLQWELQLFNTSQTGNVFYRCLKKRSLYRVFRY